MESLLNGLLICCVGRGTVSRTATIGDVMQIIEITDCLPIWIAQIAKRIDADQFRCDEWLERWCARRIALFGDR
jgi:hypothetical protein